MHDPLHGTCHDCRIASPGVAARLKATVTLTASSTHASPRGKPLVFRGRMSSAPGSAGGRKAIVLEWLDPFRKAWRPVVNARAKTDGSFAIRCRFQASGLTVPFRVHVPRERGWLIEPGVSKVVLVRVRQPQDYVTPAHPTSRPKRITCARNGLVTEAEADASPEIQRTTTSSRSVSAGVAAVFFT